MTGRMRPRPDLPDNLPANHQTMSADQISEIELTNLVLVEDAITGLRQALAGQFVSDEELDQALGVASAP